MFKEPEWASRKYENVHLNTLTTTTNRRDNVRRRLTLNSYFP